VLFGLFGGLCKLVLLTAGLFWVMGNGFVRCRPADGQRVGVRQGELAQVRPLSMATAAIQNITESLAVPAPSLERKKELLST
jgi:hypothetical protein